MSILNVLKDYDVKFWIGFNHNGENGLGINILEHIDGKTYKDGYTLKVMNVLDI